MAETGSLMADKDTTPTKLAMPRVPLFSRRLLSITTRVGGGPRPRPTGEGPRPEGFQDALPQLRFSSPLLKAGRIQKKHFLGVWTSITRDKWILKTIQQGVKIQLYAQPTMQPEPREWDWASADEKDFEWLEMAISYDAIERVPLEKQGQSGEVIHNLVCEVKKGRICSNVKTLNLLVKKMNLKMPSLKDVRAQFQKNDWMIKLDLSKFYWATLIKSSHRKFFCFRIDGVLWQWRALPFGFVNSMQIMARIMAPVVNKLASFGIRVVNWVDDFVLLLGPNKETAFQRAQKAVDLLATLGFIINQDKSSHSLTKSVLFRGFIWNTVTMKIDLPLEKKKDWQTAARMINLSQTRASDVVSLIGKVQYSAQIFTHLVAWLVELQIANNHAINANGRGAVYVLPDAAKEEVRHWRKRDHILLMPMNFNGPLVETMGDAGPIGYGFEGFEAIAGL